MKKIITLCLFALALVVNVQTTNAQDKFNVIEERLRMESQELKKLLNLDDTQTALVWRTMYAKEKVYFDRINDAEATNSEIIELKKRVDENFKSKMLEILTTEQFKTFTSWLAKQKKY